MLAAALALLLAAPAPDPSAGSLAHTYSIVARDPATGRLGVAVQSHWFQVGPIVPWAEAGVGAVATQSFVEPGYGPRGLALMKQGLSAQEALDRLLADDPQRDVRQVAMVDARGRVAVWTGPRCIAAAGHATGAGYSVQANLMENGTVWGAMARAFEAAEGELAERLLAALEAAEAAGGDIRGKQSAALLIVAAEGTGDSWRDRLVDIRVDDDPEPLAELRRLWNLHRAYEEMNAGDEAVARGAIDQAVERYGRAAELAPAITELPFWQAVTLFDSGHEEEALPIFRGVFAREERWARLVPRLPAAGLLPDDPAKLARILAQAPEADGGEVGDAEEAGDESDGEGREGGGEGAGPEERVRVTGVLTDEGVECPALRGDDGRLYTLTGDLGSFGVGDRVTVEGKVARISFCMQGTTLAVASIRRAAEPER